jgi:hypothetical protein
MEEWERQYWKGRRDGLKEALVELERGDWWRLRAAIAKALHWLAIRIEPTS